MALSIDQESSSQEQLELNLLLDTIRRRYGKDFHDYAPASLLRRVNRRKQMWGLDHISDMIPKILQEPKSWQELLTDLSTSVTEMFRDPEVFLQLKQEVFPVLSTFPFFKIWHVGCATGEEVYSLAILLFEQGLLSRAQIYGTDFNDQVLASAKDGIYALEHIQKFESAYLAAGGQRALSDYFTSAYGKCKVQQLLKDRVTFANHNLTDDGVFAEVELILCRNVLIYFNSRLKSRSMALFYDSLHTSGFLVLGTKEALPQLAADTKFEYVDKRTKIYRKRAGGLDSPLLQAR